MPGANCSIFGCSTSRKTTGVSIFKVPGGNDEFNTKWRNNLVHIITRDRIVDNDLKRQIENRRLHICERNFHEEDICRNESKSLLKPFALPKLNLPVKSIPSSSTGQVARPSLTAKRLSNAPEFEKCNDCYESYDDFVKRVQKLKLCSDWNIEICTEYCHIFKNSNESSTPQFEIFVNSRLDFILQVYLWRLPKLHTINIEYNCSMKYITLSNMIAVISKYTICSGIPGHSLQDVEHTPHVVPIISSPFRERAEPINQRVWYRSNLCWILVTGLDTCQECVLQNKTFENKKQKKLKRKSDAMKLPAKLNAPISLTSPQRLKLTLQNYRIENKQLKDEIKKMNDAINSSSYEISPELDSDMVSIMNGSRNVSPFMKLFWDEQQKYITTAGKGIRYHPMIIRYCLTLASKSPSAYDDIRYDEKNGTGFLILPSRRHLRDYKNYIKAQQGFSKMVIEELKLKIQEFTDIEKYFMILFDEMKLQENLVWCKHSGELIGFVDLGDEVLNKTNIDDESIASHILVFLLRSVVNPFKFSLANFATKDATSWQIFSIFWRAVGICELECGLRIIGVTCDGASVNRKFFRMHSSMIRENDSNGHVDVVYKVRNEFSQDNRYIYMISDPPHLIKTARNCLQKSGSGKGRLMWNNEHYLLWSHISDIYQEDKQSGLHLLPKITYEHIYLTSFSKMNVRMAAQVLSETVGSVLQKFCPDARETAAFCSLMDGFFDIVNIKNTHEADRKLKPFLKPFSSHDDSRFDWLRRVFLKYFEDWLESINSRPGNFKADARSKMFISWQTYEGIKTTVHSVIELVQFLLSKNVPYVLTERFCQDPLENYFGHQRSMGYRKENPSLYDVGYNDNTIRNQKIFRSVFGNVETTAHVEMSNEKLPCRKKAR